MSSCPITGLIRATLLWLSHLRAVGQGVSSSWTDFSVTQNGEGTSAESHSEFVNWSPPKILLQVGWVGVGPQLQGWVSEVAGTSVMAGTFQVLTGPQLCMGSRACVLLLVLGKE